MTEETSVHLAADVTSAPCGDTGRTASDRELLELAAKAAGIAIQRSRLDDPMCQDFLLVERQAGSNNAIGWNPLTDDGDALRLAVKVGIAVAASIEHDKVCIMHKSSRVEDLVPGMQLGSDPYSTVRRAIVLAAARAALAAATKETTA